MNLDSSSRLAVSVIVVVAFLAYVYLILTTPIPGDMRDVVNTAGGLLGAAFMTVVSYWVGSSAGSAAKDKTITDLSKPST